MAKERTKYDEKEVNEILDLYEKEILKGIKSKVSQSGVQKYNERLSNSNEYLNYLRKPFTLYSKDFWAGTYKGDDNYGKAQIKLRNEKGQKFLGEEFSSDVLDVMALIDRYHKYPDKLFIKLRKIINSLVEEKEIAQNNYKVIEKKYNTLKESYELSLESYTNFVFESQSPNNSLNDMFRLTKEEDAFAFGELANTFNSEKRINDIINKAKKDEIRMNEILNNVVDLNEKKKKSIPKKGYEGL
ncbi:MAG: hypothetical protein ACRC28_17040 [Clostridium sp.]|uniref:hypothetical protein n=1 Tax=Clostridium sp. TaxID=1506 RepID=UPI003F2DD4DF